MINFKANISAFTMMDILTGMTIMSIIIALVFFLFTSVNKQVYGFGKVRSEIVSYNLMKADILYNMDQAEKIIKTPLGFEFWLKDKIISYEQDNSFLIRTEGLQKDTLSHSLNHILVTETIPGELRLQEQLISALEITTSIEKKELTFYAFKTYDQSAVINQTLLNEF